MNVLRRIWWMPLVLATVMIFGTPSYVTLDQHASTGVQLQEDDPGWNCSTMGNLICGPTEGN